MYQMKILVLQHHNITHSSNLSPRFSLLYFWYNTLILFYKLDINITSPLASLFSPYDVIGSFNFDMIISFAVFSSVLVEYCGPTLVVMGFCTSTIKFWGFAPYFQIK